MLKRIFNSQSKTITGATGILAVSSIISGLLGLLTDRFLAHRFGASMETSIYFAAFRIPDLVYNILISGGILVAFLPIFTEYFSSDEKKAWQMTNYVLNIFFLLLVLISIALFILTPWLIGKFILPDFSGEGKALAIILTRILLIQPIFLGLSNIFSGVLHYFNRFLIYSLAPIFYNLGIIFGILFLAPYFGILGVGLGVILGAFLHLAIQIPSAINCGFKYEFLFNFKYPAVKKIFSLMGTRIFALSANQINLIALTAIASRIAEGSIAIFNYSSAIQGLPVTILGISLATVAFPTFSRLWVNGQKKAFAEKFSQIIRQIFFLIIPASILIFLLRAQIVRIILGTGRFGWDDTRLAAASLGLFALGIFAATITPFLIRIFFSFQDTKIPTFTAVISAMISIGLAFIFKSALNSPNFFSNFANNNLKLQGVGNIAVIGLPLAISIASILQFLLLSIFLYKKIGDFGVKEILNSLKKILLASILMAEITYVSLMAAAHFVNMQTFFGVFLQAAIAGSIGILVYVLITFYLKSPEFDSFKLSIQSKFRK
ncbi:MAG: murein biosynthesis integral membrane protein MurJ [Candidatus Pacebacteria bacterium]|nr:murein biosynthesis integral membrane protein MurJ [Candidatus Paceibacterota bacterium]